MRMYSSPRRLRGFESWWNTVGTGIWVFLRRYAMVATSDSVLIYGMKRRAMRAISSVGLEGSEDGWRVIKNA